MKIVGFYVFERVVVSPTVFRQIVLEKISGMKLGKIKEPGFKDRYDIIEFENKLPELKVKENLKKSLQTS